MPINFTKIDNADVWFGYNWDIEDTDVLARHLAKVALGQYRHVAKVLAATQADDVAPFASAFEGARSLLISKQKGLCCKFFSGGHFPIFVSKRASYERFQGTPFRGGSCFGRFVDIVGMASALAILKP